jgi:hypothetical protein
MTADHLGDLSQLLSCSIASIVLPLPGLTPGHPPPVSTPMFIDISLSTIITTMKFSPLNSLTSCSFLFCTFCVGLYYEISIFLPAV